MNDQTITSGARISAGAVLLGLVGAGLLAVAIVQANINFAIGAALPFVLAVGLWATRPTPIHAVLTETGLVVDGESEEISFSDIQSVSMAGKVQDPEAPSLSKGPIVVTHAKGVLEIPKNLNVAVTDVYHGLLQGVPESGSRQLNPALTAHQQLEEEKFGRDRVFTYTARASLGRRRSGRRGVVCSVLIGLTGLFWAIAQVIFDLPPKHDVSPWMGFGILLMVVGGVAALIASLLNRHPGSGLRGWRQASLIVSPTGIAMTQGDMSGRLRWDELLDVELDRRQGSFRISGHDVRTGGIRLRIAGAQLEIADVYDRPLPIIHRVIRRYWRPA